MGLISGLFNKKEGLILSETAISRALAARNLTDAQGRTLIANAASISEGMRSIGIVVAGKLPSYQSPLSLSNALVTLPTSVSPGFYLATIYGVPAGVTPVISPANSHFTIVGDASTGWKVVSNDSYSSSTSTTITITATGSISTSLFITVYDSNTVPLITTLTGGVSAELGVPDQYWQSVYAQVQDADNHPSLGTPTHMSAKSGNWSDPTVWNTGTVPSVGSNVMIMGDHVVNYNMIMPCAPWANHQAFLNDYRAACDVLASDPTNSSALSTIATAESIAIKGIHIGGRASLTFEPNAQTIMIVSSLMAHGNFEMGTQTYPIKYPFADSTPGCWCIILGTEDPGTNTKVGIMTMLRMRMWGETKTTFTKYAIAPTQGAVQVTLDKEPVNWRVGDKIVITSTTFAGNATSDSTYTGPTTAYVPRGTRLMDEWWPGNPTSPAGSMAQANANNFKLSHDEVRTITEIVGAVVKFSQPLARDHLPHSGVLPDGKTLTIESRCMNLSRSVRIEGAYVREKGVAGTGRHRGHTMHMHHDDGVRKFVEFKDLGRSRIDPSLFAVENNGTTMGCMTAVGGTFLADPMNVRGRYPVHDHWCGPYFARRAIISEGISIWSELDHAPSPGWGYTHHHSRSHLHEVITFNTRASGIASELGTEIGQWIDCISVYNRGDGYDVGAGQGDRQEYISNHNGHAGVAFENQSREVLMQGCIGVSSKYGCMYYQQRTHPFSARSPADTALRYFDPLVKGQTDTPGFIFFDITQLQVYGHQQVQIREWHNNEFADCDYGFYVSHRDQQDDKDVMPMLAHNFRSLSAVRPYIIASYSYNYFFKSAYLKGKGTTFAAIDIGTKTFNLNFANIRVDDTQYVLYDQFNFNFNGFYVDFNGNVPNSNFHYFGVPGYGLPIDYGTLAEHPQNGVMGSWTLISNPTSSTALVKVRNHQALTTAQMPQPYPRVGYVTSTTEPNPGTPKPYMVFDMASTGDVTPTGVNTVQLKGRIVDTWGVRTWPSFQRFLSSGQDDPYPIHTNSIANGIDLVKRNKCFLDNGVWKMRLWFVDADRGTHQYLIFGHTVNLTGFDSNFLLQYQVADANATKPSVPVLAETLNVIDTPKIETIAVIGSFVNATEVAQNSTNTSNTITVTRLTPGQTVPVTITGGTYIKNGGSPSSSPTTAKTGDTFAVVAQNSNVKGSVVNITLNVGTKTATYTSTVTNIPDTGLMIRDYFDDQSSDQNLGSRSGWELLAGTVGGLQVNAANKYLISNTTSGQTSTYRSTTDLGNTYQFVEWDLAGGGNVIDYHMLVSMTDANNWVSFSNYYGNLRINKCIGGTITSALDSVSYSSVNIGTATVLRGEYDAATGAFSMYCNGILLKAGTISGPLPSATSRQGIRVQSSSSPIASRVEFGTLAKNAFADNFNRANENLEANTNYTRIDGVAGSAVVLSNALVSAIATGLTAYRIPNRGTGKLAITYQLAAGNWGGRLAFQLTDSNNYIGIGYTSSMTVLSVYAKKAGVEKLIGSFTGLSSTSGASAPYYRTEYDPSTGTITLYQNNNILGSVVVAAGDRPPSTTHAGIVAGTSSSANTGLGDNIIWEAW